MIMTLIEIVLCSQMIVYSIYKIALRHLLLSLKIISPYDIDPANLVPHMLIRKNKNDPFSKYHKVQNKKVIITEDMLSARTDFLTIEIDEKQDLHSTLIYSKKIGNRVDLIAAIKLVIRTLNQYPDHIQEYAKLSYFGQDAIQYWYDNGTNYPFNITPPIGYKPIEHNNDIFPINVLPSGTIIK